MKHLAGSRELGASSLRGAKSRGTEAEEPRDQKTKRPKDKEIKGSRDDPMAILGY
jgi:hypothetical protein